MLQTTFIHTSHPKIVTKEQHPLVFVFFQSGSLPYTFPHFSVTEKLEKGYIYFLKKNPERPGQPHEPQQPRFEEKLSLFWDR